MISDPPLFFKHPIPLHTSSLSASDLDFYFTEDTKKSKENTPVPHQHKHLLSRTTTLPVNDYANMNLIFWLLNAYIFHLPKEFTQVIYFPKWLIFVFLLDEYIQYSDMTKFFFFLNTQYSQIYYSIFEHFFSTDP